MAACEPRAFMSVPSTSGTESSSILFITGMVSLRVLSSGPPAATFAWLFPSCGTLNSLGEGELLAVLSGLPARKKEAMRAMPAPIMARLITQEITLLMRTDSLLEKLLTAKILTSDPQVGAMWV